MAHAIKLFGGMAPPCPVEHACVILMSERVNLSAFTRRHRRICYWNCGPTADRRMYNPLHLRSGHVRYLDISRRACGAYAICLNYLSAHLAAAAAAALSAALFHKKRTSATRVSVIKRAMIRDVTV